MGWVYVIDPNTLGNILSYKVLKIVPCHIVENLDQVIESFSYQEDHLFIFECTKHKA
jgi:hypothetical protein